jgi:hypothetical protein
LLADRQVPDSFRAVSEPGPQTELSTRPQVVQTLLACVFAGVAVVGYALVGMTFGAAAPGFVAGFTCLALVVGFTFGSWVVVFAPPGILALFLALFVVRGRGTASELFDANFIIWSVGVAVPAGIGVWLRGRLDRNPDEGAHLLDRWASGK